MTFQASHGKNASYSTETVSYNDLAPIHTIPNSNTIVVIPSMDLDRKELKRVCPIAEYYEERQLYHLFLLVRDPSFRIIFLSSHSVSEDIVKYYLSIDGCSREDVEERMSRLHMISMQDIGENNLSLSQNIIERNEVVENIKKIVKEISIGVRSTVGLSVFCGSNTISELTSRLGIRLLEASDTTLYFGSKQGSREVFSLCNIPMAPGCPGTLDTDLLSTPKSLETWSVNHKFICTPSDLSIGIARLMVLQNIKPKHWVVKLNQGFSGLGNAMLDLQKIQNKKYIDTDGEEITGDRLIQALAKDIESELPKMKFQCSSKKLSWLGTEGHLGFVEQIARLGVIAEVFLEGDEIRSPSAQLTIDPENSDPYKVEIISTHEQILKGQIYQGCINPASDEYRSQLVEYAKRIGYGLLSQGVVGHFSVDFLATKKEGSWNLIANEINLRQGGTTHTCCTMLALCRGSVNNGMFYTDTGDHRCYEATDNFYDQRLRGLLPHEFLESFQNSMDQDVLSLHWNESDRTGVVFHIISLLQFGKIGFTAIGKNTEEARVLFAKTKIFLESLAKARNVWFKNENTSRNVS
jgi:hypothetical protein